MTRDCIKNQCRSPLACDGWGYCRELNMQQREADVKAIRELCSRPKSFDSECYKLAIHFLTDEPMNDTVSAESYRSQLASHIQSEIENWIQFERNRFESGKYAPLIKHKVPR